MSEHASLPLNDSDTIGADNPGADNPADSAWEAAKPVVRSDPDHLDWSNGKIVVIADQLRTALYWDPWGRLVIRQLAWPDDDPVVYFNSESAGRLIEAIIDRMVEAGNLGLSSQQLHRIVDRLSAAANRLADAEKEAD